MAASVNNTAEDEQARGWLRRVIAKELLLGDGVPPHGYSEFDAQTRVYAVKLMQGVHFPAGAKYLGEMTAVAMSTVSTLANAFKHLEPRAKDVAGISRMWKFNRDEIGRAPVDFKVETLLVPVPSAADTNGKRCCLGWMIFWIVRPLKGFEEDGDAAADNNQPAGGGRARANAAPAQGKTRKFNTRLLEKARQAPLSVGLARSFAEARVMAAETTARRAAYIKEHRRRGEDLVVQQARVAVKTPESLPEYRFAAFRDIESFMQNAVQGFFRAPTGLERAVPTHDPGNAFLDFVPGDADAADARAAVASKYAGTPFDVADYFVDRDSGIHPDDIFCVPRALAYFNRGIGRAVEPRATQYAEYHPGVVGQQPGQHQHQPAPRQRRLPRLDPASLDEDEAAERSEAHLHADADDDDDGDGGGDNDATNNGTRDDLDPVVGEALANADAQLHIELDADDDDGVDDDLRPWLEAASDHARIGGRPHFSLPARPAFPYPRLVYRVNEQATYSELLSTIMPLPHAIGAELPSEAFMGEDVGEQRDGRFQPMLPRPDPISITQALKQTVTLRMTEHFMTPSTNALENALFARETEEFSPLVRTLPSGLTAVHRTVRNGVAVDETVAVQRIENAQNPIVTADVLLDQERERERADAAAAADSVPDAAEEQRLADEGALGVPPRLMIVYHQQRGVVRDALLRLSSQFRACAYKDIEEAWLKSQDSMASDTHMPLVDFYPPRPPAEGENLSMLEIIRRQFEMHKGKLKLTPAQERSVYAYVDVTPQWMSERNEFLEHRPNKQLAHGLMMVRQEAERAALLLKAAAEGADAAADATILALNELDRKHASERHDFTLAAVRDYVSVWETTERISPAVKAVRDYYLTTVKPNRAKGVVKPAYIDGRHYFQVRQFYLDSYRSGERVTKQNAAYMERAHTCGHHSMRWQPHRTDPALNYTVSGPSGAGKSFAIEIVTSMTPPGVVSDTTSETTNSYNVEQDFDGHIVLYQELDSRMLFTAPNKDDAGATDKINFTKARMTSFFTRVKYFRANEQTGKREAAECFSSQHIVTMGATNQDLTLMDKNMKRRLLIDNVAESAADSEGNQVSEIDKPGDGGSAKKSVNISQQARSDHRELFCYYTMVESAYKMGVLPDVLTEGGRDFLHAVLRDAQATLGISTSGNGQRVWVLEVARILAMQEMCYKSLYSPEADQLHQHTPIKRWSPEALCLFSEPHKFVGKEHVMHALTMFDILYTSRIEEHLLATIALKVLRLDSPARWRFRKTLATGDDAAAGARDDYNYLSFKHNSLTGIGALIAECHNSVSRFRAEDVLMRLKAFEHQKRSTRGFDLAPAGAREGPALQRLTYGAFSEMPVLIIERDPTSDARKPPWQCSFLIEFFESRFNFDVETDSPETIRARVERPNPRISADLFESDDAASRLECLQRLRDLAVCADKHAPLVSSIRRTLNMPHLEESIYEHPTLLPVPPKVFSYMTFYPPEDTHLDFPDGHSIRVALDGVGLQLQGVRTPGGRSIRRDNFAKPSPTARASLFGLPPGTPVPEDSAEMSRGVIYNRFDPDFYMVNAVMERSGHPGIPFLHDLFLKACVHFRDKKRFPSEEAYLAQLYRAVPELDPAAGVPLPFAFAPIAYRIQQYLMEVVYKVPQHAHYPECNLYERLDDTVKRTDGQRDNNRNNAYQEMSNNTKIDQRRRVLDLKRRHRTDDDDDEERPAKRARRSPPLRRTPAPVPTDDAELDAMDIDRVPPPAAARLIPAPTRGRSRDDNDDDDDDDVVMRDATNDLDLYAGLQ